MVVVLVGDEDTVKAIEVFFNGCEPGQSFALAQSGIDK